MATGADRFLRQQIAAIGDVPELQSATVTAVTAGASTDGIALVTVNYLGRSTPMRYLTSYTPVVGHVVALARHAGDWLILGRVGGFPPVS